MSAETTATAVIVPDKAKGRKVSYKCRRAAVKKYLGKTRAGDLVYKPGTTLQNIFEAALTEAGIPVAEAKDSQRIGFARLMEVERARMFAKTTKVKKEDGTIVDGVTFLNSVGIVNLTNEKHAEKWIKTLSELPNVVQKGRLIPHLSSQGFVPEKTSSRGADSDFDSIFDDLEFVEEEENSEE